MLLVIHQLQGSCATFPSRPLSWSRGVKLKQHVATVCVAARTDRSFLLKRNIHLGVGACGHGPRVKHLKISAFKGNAQKDELGRRPNGSAAKNSVKLSYLPKENEESISEAPNVQSVPVSYTSDSEGQEGIMGSPAIRKLFRRWLNMLHTESPSQVVDGIVGAELPQSQELPQTENATENKENVEILKSVWSHFLRLDAMIKVPLMIFIPLYLAVNVAYGAEVSKDLTPLWILGPLIVAFYMKMLQGLWALYVFSFTQTVKIIKNLPGYYRVTYSYIAQGKLKEHIRACLVQPVVDIKNLDYKEVSRKEMKKLEEWFVDKYLDFVESIWPYYCQTIRFLKRANLI